MNTISTVFLFRLHIRSSNGDIVMNCTQHFFEMLRSKFWARPGATLRVGSFDFTCTRRDHYLGTPDERNQTSRDEANKLCHSILAVYRLALTFEKVFPTPKAYGDWFALYHRSPSPRELSDLARQRGVYVPFLPFPFQSTLMTTPADYPRLPPVIAPVAPAKLEALARRFSSQLARR